MDSKTATNAVRQEALRLGFSQIAFSKAEQLDAAARRLEQWLNKAQHGNMGYMANHFEKRIDPRKLVEGTKTVVSLIYNYYTEKQQTDATAPKIAMYALGEDYHVIVKDKLKQLYNFICTTIGDVQGRCFVDSAPIMERDWAARGGLGWVGKNTLLIHPKKGSYFFIADILLDATFDYDNPIKDYCGTCRKCIDACPTDAIATNGYWLDATKCISYATIELRDDALPNTFKNKMENWMFGCDICQQVCPWNRFSQPHSEPAFEPTSELLNLTKTDWLDLTEEVFKSISRKTPLQRAKYKGIKRNISFLSS
ncbi:MAG: tRNA epoxyqueuosine(34) reductase QueG [Saprospiraceae bacterium]|nr:tRNA epoxyqueuosine(34) reductase QueG [Saprospiraceae bacterium]MBP7699153.1 tRNA epoxyqueuosine(34) reductase QueG [Saprospiraceae bacterium]